MKLRKFETGYMEPDMTPMIGIVFQLLTFFMIAIYFLNTKANERVRLPQDVVAKPPTVKSEHELILKLGYQRDDTGQRINEIPTVFYSDRYVEVRQISDDLEQERRVIEKIHGADVIKDVTVVIQADSEVPNGMVQELIKRCQQSGFFKFSLRVSNEEI